MNFDLLKQVESKDELCSKHQIKLSKLKDRPAFCTECAREKLEKQKLDMEKSISKKNQLRRTVETLEKDSILSDSTLWNASFDNYIADNEETDRALKQAKTIAVRYLDKSNNFNTILTGVPGAGKSHLAMSILKLVNDNQEDLGSCLFVSISTLLMMVKDSISNPKSKYTKYNMLELLKRVDLLVLDDFGSESSFKKETTESSEYNQGFIFEVLEARNRTIITTNLTSDEMNKIYNQKIVSRLHKGVEGNIIKFTQATKDKRSGISY